MSSVLGSLAQLIALLMTEPLDGVIGHEAHGHVSTEGEPLDPEYVNAELGTHAHGKYLTTTSCPGIFSGVIIQRNCKISMQMPGTMSWMVKATLIQHGKQIKILEMNQSCRTRIWPHSQARFPNAASMIMILNILMMIS